MRLITPERQFKFIDASVSADEESALTNPVGVGQVMIINGVLIVVAPIETAAGNAEGTLGLFLTGDQGAGDFLALGDVEAQDAQDGDNVMVAALDYSHFSVVVTSGGLMFLPQKGVWDWRGLKFEERPMTNVDLAVIFQPVATTAGADMAVTLWYQIAELEESDLGFLPIGARIVRNVQVPAEGVTGPAGLVALN